ncbi:phospholipase A and acyltransferase 4-like [Pungitius pungitius]|uniref:phospholipase A and acyltransferase 4-like n=1 Tax=Pungitius pungitius TaxID=134920 RepID=UPI002E155A2D
MALSQYCSGAQPGDLIEIFRRAYQHWALYVGDNEVIHLTTPGDSGYRAVTGDLVGTVERHKIWEVVHNDRFKVNNQWDYKWEPRDRGVVVREACSMEGERIGYSAVSFNCEHFVTWLRYGKEESRQVQVTTAAVIGGGVVAVGLVALAAALFGNLLKDDDEEDGTRGRRERRHRRRQQ